MRLTLVILLLAACSDPTLNAGVTLNANGVKVRPSVSTNFGGLGVTVAP